MTENGVMELETREGTVTEVNIPLLYFRLDKEYINIGRYMAVHGNVRKTIPAVGEKIRIKNLHRNPEMIDDNAVFTLCAKKKMAPFSQEAFRCLDFLWSIEEYHLGISDLYKVTKNNEHLKGFMFEEVPSSNIISWYISMIGNLIHAPAKEISCCEFKRLPELEFRTISQYGQSMIRDRPLSLKIWSFGTIWAKTSDVLVGLLYVNPSNGTVWFKDQLNAVRCIIVGNNIDIDSSKFLNKILYIKDYCYFVEHFNKDGDYSSLEYLYFDAKNVEVFSKYNVKAGIEIAKFSSIVRFHLLAKSFVRHSPDVGNHYWLMVHLLGAAHGRVFIRCPKELTNIWYEFQVSHEYSIKIDGILTPILDHEFMKIHEIPQYTLIETKILSKREVLTAPDLPHLNVSNFRSFNGLVSFHGRIKKRTYVETENETPPQIPLKDFGMIDLNFLLCFEIQGSSHCLYVGFDDKWLDIITPLGFIEGVMMDVRNIRIHKPNLALTTPLTSFDVYKYEPKLRFSTALLNSETDWGKIEYLGNPYPDYVYIHGVINAFHTLHLSIKLICDDCYERKQPCVDCEGPRTERYSLFIYALDSKGISKIHFKSFDDIRVLLGVKTEEIPYFKGEYTFKRNNSEDIFIRNRIFERESEKDLKIGIIALSGGVDPRGRPRWYVFQARQE